MSLSTTQYYDEFLRYYQLAKDQQEKCNVSSKHPYGMLTHAESKMGDALLENVELYDVVERKFAGFSQIVNDCFYGWNADHPYWMKMSAGNHTAQRKTVATNWNGKKLSLAEWLYVFILHRVTGSAINYATKPSGYHNTLLFKLHAASSIPDMTEIVKAEKSPFYTSVGYQFPAFPKPPAGYKRGGDYYLCEFAPRLATELADFLVAGNKKTLREIGEFMLSWNQANGMRRFAFQYAAVVADVADWFPQYVHRDTPFYYGTNAIECISYLAVPTKKMKTEAFLDLVMEKIQSDTGAFPYNAEDVCCDFIRWVENYVRPGAAYNHLDRDNLWSSHRIHDHPYGRQKPMLELGLIKSFNDLDVHPSDDYVISRAGVTVEKYKELCKTLK